MIITVFVEGEDIHRMAGDLLPKQCKNESKLNLIDKEIEIITVGNSHVRNAKVLRSAKQRIM